MLYLEARVRGKVNRWPLAGESFIIGRGESCDVDLNDKSVSRAHLRLTVKGRSILVEDLGSANGLLVEGRRVDRAELQADRWFAAGGVMLVVRRSVTLTSSGPKTPSPKNSQGDRPTLENPERESMSPAQGSGPQLPAEPWDQFNGLAANLEKAPGPEAALEIWLEGLLRLSGVEGVILLYPVDNRWVVRSLAGRPIPPDLENEFFQLVSGHDRENPIVRSGKVLGHVVHRPGRDQGWLLFYPWPGDVEPGAQFRLAAAVCGQWPEKPILPRENLFAPRSGGNQAVVEEEVPEFICVSPLCQAMLREVDRLAVTGLPILLLGESGTGKELLARRIHARSPRRAGPFLAINCAALPRDLLEAELFGIERGVATGVEPRAGRFAEANGGTLLLDEIGDLPMELQPKLLRVLESGEVARLGARRPIPVDVRIVAATHQDLSERVRNHAFRLDLFHRIAGATVKVPALRERPEDILPLAREFARKLAGDSQGRFQGLDLEAARLLLGYSWPGNVRELFYAVSRAVALSDGPVLHPALLPSDITGQGDLFRADLILGLNDDFRSARQAFEKFYFGRMIQRCEGNLSEVARMAGLTRSHLYNKLDELGLREGRVE